MEIVSVIVAAIAAMGAVLSAWMAQRSAVAAERAAARDPWEITGFRDGERTWLKNTSRRTAFDVVFESAEANPALRLADVPCGETIHAGARRILIIGAGVTKQLPRVTVRWREEPDGRRFEWTTGL